MSTHILTGLGISFENVEGIIIPGKYVIDLDMSKFKTKYYGRKSDEEGLYLHRYKIAKEILIIISKDAKDEYFFEHEKYLEFFKRVKKYPDIVSFDLIYADGTVEEIHVEWDGDSYYENKLQESFIDNNGNLVIKIGKFDIRE